MPLRKKDGGCEGIRRIRSLGWHFFGDFLVAGDKKVTRLRHKVAGETAFLKNKIISTLHLA